MRPPIYVYEPDDLSTFETVEAAERYIEPWGIREDLFYFYDSEGQMLDGMIVVDSRGIEYCRIVERSDAKFAPDDLAIILTDSLEYLGYKRDELSTMSLQGLVGESLKFLSR